MNPAGFMQRTAARLCWDNAGIIAGGTNDGWRIVSSGDIVVGVDESPEARWAVLWAAREARLRAATLSLAHVKSSVTDDRAADDLESEAETLLIVRAAESLGARAGDIGRAETL